jgi:hypothetical protein
MPNKDSYDGENFFHKIYDSFVEILKSMKKVFLNSLRGFAKSSRDISISFNDLLFGPTISSSVVDLVSAIAFDVVGDIVKNQFGLTYEEQEDIRQRANIASEHLAEAGKILAELQTELTQRSNELDSLLADIDNRRAEAEHWQEMAMVNEKLASALTREIERRVRDQIRSELDRNKTRRRIVGLITWIITLISGGVVGAIIQQWWQTGTILWQR